jgi:hypothetical protein
MVNRKFATGQLFSLQYSVHRTKSVKSDDASSSAVSIFQYYDTKMARYNNFTT